MSLYRLARDGDSDELATHLVESGSTAVRRRAAELLGDTVESGEDDVIEALITAAKDDPDPRVRGAAVDALDQLGQEPLEALIAELADVHPEGAADWAAAREYREFLSADRPELRLAAATVLGRLGGQQVAPALRERFDDPDSRVRSRAVQAAGRIGVRTVASAVADVLATDDSPRVRREAAEALGAIGDPRTVSALVDGLEDANSDVRRACVTALGELGDPAAIDEVVGRLTDDDEAVRQATAFALIDLLANAPADRSHDIRETMVDELRAVEEPIGVVEPLVDILESGANVRHRRNAAWLLGQVAPSNSNPRRDVVDALADALCSSDETVARFAATSLVSLGGEPVEDVLIDRLTDEEVDERARAKAAFALGKVGGDRARERLSDIVDSTESETVRERAFAALSKLGGTRESGSETGTDDGPSAARSTFGDAPAEVDKR